MSGIVVQGGKAVKRVPHTGSPNSPVFSQLRVLCVSVVKFPSVLSLFAEMEWLCRADGRQAGSPDRKPQFPCLSLSFVSSASLW